MPNQSTDHPRTLDKTCPQCGASFTVRWKERGRVNCSLSCASRSRERTPRAVYHKTCKHCGQPFQTLAKKKHQQWCSRRCAIKARMPYVELQTLSERFWSKVHVGEPPDCWTWTGYRDRRGYGRIAVPDGSAQPIRLAHRVSWEIAHGPIPPGIQVCHHCDNPSCVYPSHLFLGDMKANVEDMYSKGRARPRGKVPLTAEQRRKILDAVRAGESCTSLAERYHVTESAISWFKRKAG